MTERKKILAISGSTRQHSTNLNLIRAIADLTTDTFDVKIMDGIADIPHFNPDLDHDTPPIQVAYFRKLIREADGVLICTPEYAMGVPGTLKNAIDWTVSSGEFSHKPVALITASSQGHKGHAALLETLRIIECNILDSAHLVVSFAKTKVSREGTITDQATLQEITSLLGNFDKLIESSRPGPMQES